MPAYRIDYIELPPVAGILTDQAPETWTLTISDQVTPGPLPR